MYSISTLSLFSKIDLNLCKMSSLAKDDSIIVVTMYFQTNSNPS